VIDITFVALLAFGLVVQLGLSIAIILGLLAFNFGSMLGDIGRELVTLAVARELLPLGRAFRRRPIGAARVRGLLRISSRG
jgi:hypothetical protein